MRYFDTNILVSLILPESTSMRITQFVAGLPSGGLAISHWTRVEFSSMLAREVRMGGLDAKAARDADRLFEKTVAESFAVLLPRVAEFELARQYLARYESGLRAGDALHLAIASNHHASAIYSLDRTLIKAGKMLGLPVSAGISGGQ